MSDMALSPNILYISKFLGIQERLGVEGIMQFRFLCSDIRDLFRTLSRMWWLVFYSSLVSSLIAPLSCALHSNV